MTTATKTWSSPSGDILLGVIGSPISHSKSPVMHNAGLRALGIPGAYVPLHVEQDKVKETIEAIRTLNFRGINVTIPHKLAVIEHLDRVDPAAEAIGAVNTIVNDNGILTGYNTDGIGYVRSLKSEAVSELSGRRIMVIGAGGAARGIIDALLQEQPSSVVIVNRDEEKAKRLAGSWSSRGDIKGVGLDQIQGYIGGTDILINTTSVGMHPHVDDMPIDPDIIPEGIVVSDLIYNPLYTRLLLESRSRRGCIIHSGVGMFLYQGAYALEYWTGLPAPIEAMREALLGSLGAAEPSVSK
ncbi:shikimate dehydrogenase [Paenibacillus forsythiae]|uniref:Shikimate dehydrogenase (NADP(+)) n=1 Tax=Paenibacillus forsythiae TaxID=365616 RepID=A0ABU3H257_9BACL|nr:shikimate dehydrogenase [Paenibacillus forsythiae]MDT3424904.1 shikimate dehydrogenase [Paenibacillus forsythiae]